MSAWRNLERALQDAMVAEAEEFSIPAALTRELEALKRMLGGSGSHSPPRDLLQEAVSLFRQTGELPNLSTARSVCYGSAIRFGQTEPPLIEVAIFRNLLLTIDEYRDEPRRYRRCYKGLLHTYFIYDGEEAPESGRRNWTYLRGYLEQHRGAVRAEGVTPDWVETIDDHANLLSEDPVSKYGPELLEGRTEIVRRIQDALGIDSASWFGRKLVLAQIEAASHEYDEGFRKHVHALLKLIAGYQLLENIGLQLVLNRYAQIRDPMLHPELRDRALASWGSPWLEQKKVNWSRVSPDAQRLMTTWIKRDIIRNFFEVLSEDRQTDKRRLKFWLQYHDQIDDMYFALGRNVSAARSTDIQQLRAKMEDRHLRLVDGGGPHNNAFIMLMGKYIVVEFGSKGNACFIFDKANLPFTLEGDIAGDRMGLKHDSREHRLLHMDGSDLTWESKFRRILAQCGVHSECASARSDSTVREPETSERRGGRSTRAQLVAFLNDNGVLWEDKTAKGGNLKVLHTRFTGPIGDQLKKWGFAYSVREFWYRREWP